MEAANIPTNRLNDCNDAQIVKVRLDMLRPSRFQAANKVTRHRVEKLKKSFLTLQRQLTPILVTLAGEIIAGHNRVQAAKEIGWVHVNAIVVPEHQVEQAFIDEHGEAMNASNWAASQGRNLSLDKLKVAKPITAKDIEQSIYVFRSIENVNRKGYPPSAYKTVFRVHQLLVNRLNAQNIPSVQEIGAWLLEHRMLDICKRVVESKPFPAKRLLTAIINKKAFRA